jgi:Potential Queuosine, Q, salvage protein family
MLGPVSDVLDRLRSACRLVAARARHVQVIPEAVPAYAASLPLGALAAADMDPGAAMHLQRGSREVLSAFWLTLDAINFGSGWFPTLRKRDGRSGYGTVATGVRERFERRGPWSAGELAVIDAAEVAAALGQDPDHELMGLFAASLRDLGARTSAEHAGRFAALAQAAGGSAASLVERLGHWDCFDDVSEYDDLSVPFLKRAQITAADLAQAGLAPFTDLDRLTMFADNLVPHVLRLDGVLRFEPGLVERIERGELLTHGSAEEVEIRACALHAVELIVAARPGTCAADVDRLLWNRGQQPSYKAVPRHRARCRAY